MKLLSKLAILSVAGLSFVSVPAHAALDTTFNNNDVLLGFRATSGNGSTTQLVFNLGSASSLFRDATANYLNVATIGSSLSATYGATWYDRTDLWSGFIAATNGNPINNTGPGIGAGTGDTDPNSTIYVSTRRTSVGSGATAPGNRNSNIPGNVIALDAQAAGGEVSGLGATFSTTHSSGIATMTDATLSGWSNATSGFVTSSNAIDFGTFNVETNFGSGDRGSFAAAGTSEQLWDFYRVGNFGATPGVGTFEGTFSINQSGQVDFIVVPEPSTYALLALGAAVVFFAVRRRKLAV